MKTTILSGVALLFGCPVLHGQWTVYDPAVHRQQIISTAQEIAKFVEVIDNQLKQLETLKEQAATLRHYVELFGNPATVLPAAVAPLRAELDRSEAGRALGSLVAAADATAAMVHDGHGLFRAIGAEFLTPEGARVARAGELYRPVAALQATADNFLDVVEELAVRRVALKAEISRTTAALAAARTDAEVQKLSGVLVGLSAALQGADHELNEATASVLVQDAANRGDERRQEHAQREEQAAQFTEAMENYGRVFRLVSRPVAFPTP